MRYKKPILISILMLFFVLSCSGTKQSMKSEIPAEFQDKGKKVRQAYMAGQNFLDICKTGIYGIDIMSISALDTIVLNQDERILNFYFNKYFARRPFRMETVQKMHQIMNEQTESGFKNYEVNLISNSVEIDRLIPNFFIPDKDEQDSSKYNMVKKTVTPLKRNNSKPLMPSKGLYGRHIAMWNSHGWYYENSLDRWEWQRARNFQVVEDIFPTAFVIPYILPMLENAGAVTLLPRERDVNINEVIVDNDTDPDDYKERGGWTTGGSGFAKGKGIYKSGENPFTMGTWRKATANNMFTSVNYSITVPETDYYAVYVSYHHDPENVDDAKYTIYHAGGKSEYLVNQQIGGETWVYLGKFKFMKGEKHKITLSTNRIYQNRYLSADAVRVGGGMGSIERSGKLSERPRWTEAARYYLQYSGIPDYVYNIHKDTVDYNDDYKCRGEWVNYLKGAPYGPTGHRDTTGLDIPIDMSFAFHTDAGTTRNDTVIGTLLIYSRRGGETNWNEPSKGEELTFPDGQSRNASRDLADILQTQIVDDIRAKYDPAWNRREMWDAGYSEAWRPNVPGALLELLSHHNFLDMKFGNDPQFRFDVSRAIYKGMLKFLSFQNDQEFVVQPLPPDHVVAEILHGKAIRLKWREVLDPLELSAKADKYIVYTRKENGGFDDGILLSAPECLIPDIKANTTYSFKISSVNEGGESFPSEIVSLCYVPGAETVLVVNGFDRVSGPEILETEDYLGFMDSWGKSVADGYDLAYTGSQYDFLANSKWLDDDSPGNGASYGDYEDKVIPGNTHDFPYVHGKALVAAGYSFVSCSDEAVTRGMIDMESYPYVDIIYGEQKKTPWPRNDKEPRFPVFTPKLMNIISDYCQQGGNVFASGAYIGTDLLGDTSKISFAQNVLKYSWRTDHASRSGNIYSVSTGRDYQFVNIYDKKVYAAEHPDGIEPVKGSNGVSLLRYKENNISAASAWQGDTYSSVILGFPFETLRSETDRNLLMKQIMNILSGKQSIHNKSVDDGREKSSNNKK